MMSDADTAWAATLHVRPIRGIASEFQDIAGAYVFVLAKALNDAHYRELVTAEMEGIGLTVIELMDSDRFVPSADDAPDIRDCAMRLSDKWPVQYGSFQAYPYDDA